MSASPSIVPPTRRRRASQERSRATVQRICEATTALIADQGAHAVTMSEIARQAGMVIGTLYQYFGDRTAIYRAILIDHQVRARAMLHSHVEAIGSKAELVEALVASFDDYYAMLQRDRMVAGLWSMTQTAPELNALELADTLASAQYLAAVEARFDPTLDVDRAVAGHALRIQFSMYAGMLALQFPGAVAQDIAPVFRDMMRASMAAERQGG